MGIFSFVKAAGPQRGEAGAPDASHVKRDLDTLGLGTAGVSVSVDGDKILLAGTVADQTVFEKSVVAVGNTNGIAGVDATGLMLAGGAPETPVLYSVEPGDDLWSIAEAAYGKGEREKYATILSANGPMVTDPEQIYPGQVLRIPDASTL